MVVASSIYLVAPAEVKGALRCLLHPSIRHQGPEKQGHSTDGGR